MRRLRRILKWAAGLLVVVLLALAAPVAYVEAACQSDESSRVVSTLLPPEWQRPEANSYLTYPEWHIVYAYEGLANVMKTEDEHGFDYLASITGFWRAACALSKEASAKGQADFATRSTMHTIGVSFTLEMALKALYEETLGRVFAGLRGDELTLQDKHARVVADDYAAFLQQVPWYKYDFEAATKALWALPATGLRSWERRIALGIEWKAKAAYAKAIAAAVAGVGPAKLRIRSVVGGLPADELARVPGVRVVETLEKGFVVIETDRYRAFTGILRDLAARGATVLEIAGNDDILVTLISDRTVLMDPAPGERLAVVPRDGFGDLRTLASVKVPKLLELLAGPNGSRVEHVYDY